VICSARTNAGARTAAERAGGRVVKDGIGLTVHVAARVAALAAAGEVLVTGTVDDVVVGSSLAFADRGRRELRGVPGDWLLCAVR